MPPTLSKAAKAGPLLREAFRQLNTPISDHESFLTAHLGIQDDNTNTDESQLPIVIKLPTISPKSNEPWFDYRSRVEAVLEPIQNQLAQEMGLETIPLLTANGLQVNARPDQLEHLLSYRDVRQAELDPLLHLTLLNDVLNPIDELPSLRMLEDQGWTGQGVKVAILDSGADVEHPYLPRMQSISVCNEAVEVPGKHGTHCAGCLAGTDTYYRGVAPGIDMINIKVLNAYGRGRPSQITLGIDRALDEGSEVISMSLGFNLLPTWSRDGHGWGCTAKRPCALCTSVASAVQLRNVLVVAAAGNWHQHAQTLQSGRRNKAKIPTELCCPGQNSQVISVGAITKQTYQRAPFSSYGVSVSGDLRPDLYSEGVNITSTLPVPRDANGRITDHSRAELFGRDSGTSMATPLVAGAVALLIQRAKRNNLTWTPVTIKQQLLTACVSECPWQSTKADPNCNKRLDFRKLAAVLAA